MIAKLGFRMLFGGKPWYKSMVGWAAITLLVAETAIPAIGELGLVDPEFMAALTTYMEKLAALLGVLGIRRRLPASGTIAAVSVAALMLTLGCASYSIEFIDKKGDPVVVESSLGGRGCLALTFDENGEVDLITQQDASSDWAGVRVIPTLAKVAITALFGDRSSGEGADFTGPSGIAGCKGLFESALGEEDSHTHEVMLE